MAFDLSLRVGLVCCRRIERFGKSKVIQTLKKPTKIKKIHEVKVKLLKEQYRYNLRMTD
jgi:hypothetical protein